MFLKEWQQLSPAFAFDPRYQNLGLKRALKKEPESVLIRQNIRKIEKHMSGCLSLIFLMVVSGGAFVLAWNFST